MPQLTDRKLDANLVKRLKIGGTPGAADSETSGSDGAGAAVSDVVDFLSRQRFLWRRLDKLRLVAEILQVRTRYDDLAFCLSGQELESLRQRLESVRDNLIWAALQSLLNGQIENGWKFLHELEREMVLVLDPMELEARFVSALSEARKKLDKQWRGVATQSLGERYGSNEQVGAPASAEFARRQRDLQEILFHLHTYHENRYHKLDKLRAQLSVVCAGVFGTLVAILVLNSRGFFAPLDLDPTTLRLAVLSGLTGGVLSVAFSVVGGDPGRKIPEISRSFVVTLIRPFVGALIALPLLFFAESGLLNLGTGPVRVWALLALCFIGGFSERWFLGIVRVLGEQAQAAAESRGKDGSAQAR